VLSMGDRSPPLANCFDRHPNRVGTRKAVKRGTAGGRYIVHMMLEIWRPGLFILGLLERVAAK